MEKRYLNVREAAAYLGRTERALRALILRRKIPFRKVGGRVIIDRLEADQWVKESPGTSAEQLEGLT